MAELLRLAGYSAIGLTIPTGLLRDRIDFLKRVFRETGINTALRIDLAPPSRIELLRLLRRFRNSCDVVAVNCVNPRVATVACRDRRVDVVFFDPANPRFRLTHPLANLLRGALEFNLVSTLLKESRGEVFSAVVKQNEIAVEHNVKVVLSSGCTHPEMVRSPSQITALACAMGLSEAQSQGGVSSIPISLIVRNSMRRSPQFVEEGVRVVLPEGKSR